MQHSVSRSRSPIRTLVLATLLIIIAACGDSTGPGGGGGGGSIFGAIGGLLGGYTGTGFNSFGQKLDQQFIYLYFNESLVEGGRNCEFDRYCGLGGLRNTFGTIVEADSFMFVSTANIDHSGTNWIVWNSGVQTKPLTIANAAQYSAARASFEFVFATARLNPATHNDSAIVRIKSGTDSATLFKVTSADLQSGKYAARGGGCGSASIIQGRAITYGNCTIWIPATVDLTAYKGRTFALQFIVGEANQVAGDAVDQPTTFLFRKLQLEAAP
jgi:hypothetical protein